MCKIININSDMWTKSKAIIDVNRFMESKGMDPNRSISIISFSNYIGLNVYLSEFKNKDVAGFIDSDINEIYISDELRNDHYMQVQVVSYLLGLYYYNQKLSNFIKKTSKEEDMIKLFKRGTDLVQLSKQIEMNKSDYSLRGEIYKDTLEESKEGDPELYYFYKELAKRDDCAKLEDRYF